MRHKEVRESGFYAAQATEGRIQVLQMYTDMCSHYACTSVHTSNGFIHLHSQFALNEANKYSRYSRTQQHTPIERNKALVLFFMQDFVAK